MSKFIVITKKEIIKTFLFTLLLLAFIIFLYYFSFKEIPTFSLNSANDFKDISRDLTGDGIVDTLRTEVNNGYYNIKIKTSYGDYLLKDNFNNSNLIQQTNSTGIKFDFLDLTRDSIPEIIIYGNKDASPYFYIFNWYENNFTEIYSTKKNIFGVIDSKNSRTPQIFSTNSNKGDESTDGILFNNNLSKDINFNKNKIPSLGTIQAFIDLIQLENELTETPDLFSPYIASEELGLLWNLDKNKFRYSFQNGYFKDIDWTTEGKSRTLVWVLSFEKVNIINSTAPPSEILLIVKLSLDELGEYKINSINK